MLKCVVPVAAIAFTVVGCAEKQRQPTELVSSPAFSVYDFDAAPSEAFVLPPGDPANVIAAASVVPGIELVTNGDFTGGFSGWTVNDFGSGFWFIHAGGNVSGFPVPNPPSAPNAAMTQQPGGGRHILYQDVTLPAQLCGAPQLSFQLFIGNRAPGGFFTPPSLHPFAAGQNQQFRMDIMDPAAAIDDVGAGVLQNVYKTLVGDPTISGYALVTAPVTAPAGSTIRLRFAEVDNQYFFQAGVDNVSLVAQPDVQAPAIALAVSPTTLWPVNHKMVKVATGIAATDDCDAAPTVTVAVSSNEPINGGGDGNTAPDFQVVTNTNGSFDVYLRAERSGKGTSRIYTITVTATDSFGNVSTASGTVTVPHDQR